MNWSLLVTYIIAECFIPYWICIVLDLFSLCLLHIGSRNTDQDIGIRLSHHVLFLQILKKFELLDTLILVTLGCTLAWITFKKTLFDGESNWTLYWILPTLAEDFFFSSSDEADMLLALDVDFLDDFVIVWRFLNSSIPVEKSTCQKGMTTSPRGSSLLIISSSNTLRVKSKFERLSMPIYTWKNKKMYE